MTSLTRILPKVRALIAILTITAWPAHSGEPLKGPDDPTLFGNPSCVLWPKADQADRLNWLNAIVGTLIVTRRINTKGIKDPYNTKAVLVRGTQVVDEYCNGKPQGMAIDGAGKFLESVRADDAAGSDSR